MVVDTVHFEQNFWLEWEQLLEGMSNVLELRMTDKEQRVLKYLLGKQSFEKLPKKCPLIHSSVV
jgi:hypothetical protein